MRTDDQLDYLKKQSAERPLARREFLRALTLASAGTGLLAAGFRGFALTRHQRREVAEAVIGDMGKLPHRQFGTHMGKMMIAPICMSQDWNHDLIAPALAMGINFIHKAGYWGNNVPDEIKNLPRDSFYCDITVDNTSPGHNPDNYDEAYNQVVNSLEKNGLKYYDIYRAHYGWQSVKAFKSDPQFFNVSYKAFQRLKREGKVKYFGVSQHPYVPYPEIIQAQIDSGIIDCMQVWDSYQYNPEAREIFAKASKAGVGMTAMKINAYGRDKMRANPARMAELKAPGMVGRALLRDTLSFKREDGKPAFHTCVSALGNMEHFEENVGAISTKVSLRDGFDFDFA